MPSDPHYWSPRHKRWREFVLRRSKYLCQECARFGKRTPATTAHHIKPRQEYPDLQYDVSNGMALCEACHAKQHPEKGSKAMKSRPPHLYN